MMHNQSEHQKDIPFWGWISLNFFPRSLSMTIWKIIHLSTNCKFVADTEYFRCFCDYKISNAMASLIQNFLKPHTDIKSRGFIIFTQSKFSEQTEYYTYRWCTYESFTRTITKYNHISLWKVALSPKNKISILFFPWQSWWAHCFPFRGC